MRQHLLYICTAICTVAALAIASTAMAGYLKGDPRVCSLTPAPSAVCAIAAAHETTVARMKAYTHNPAWSLYTTCRVTGPTLFRFRCSFAGGHVSVWFHQKANGGWVRTTTVVMA